MYFSPQMKMIMFLKHWKDCVLLLKVNTGIFLFPHVSAFFFLLHHFVNVDSLLDSCPLQMLFIQLRVVNEANRWRLVDSVSRWLVAVIAAGSAAPSWIHPVASSSQESHVSCIVRFTSTLIMLLFDAFEMLQEIIEERGTILSYFSWYTSNELIFHLLIIQYLFFLLFFSFLYSDRITYLVDFNNQEK